MSKQISSKLVQFYFTDKTFEKSQRPGSILATARYHKDGLRLRANHMRLLLQMVRKDSKHAPKLLVSKIIIFVFLSPKIPLVKRLPHQASLLR
jgi:hypothetical protein